MKRYLAIILPIVAAICLWYNPYIGHAKVDTRIQMTDIKISNEAQATSRQAISNNPIELRGTEEEVTLYYTLISSPASVDNKLVLNLRYSELLIAPSSVTVTVDGQTKVSKPLSGKIPKQQLVIPLIGEELGKGVHTVTINFYGVLKEGICVNQGTSGNWLSIGIDSYFQLSGQINSEEESLSDYPRMFTGTTKNPVLIVQPDNASVETMNSALKVAAFLTEQSIMEESIRVVRESDIKNLSGNVIFIGAQTEFSTLKMKNLLSKAKLPNDQQALLLSRHKLVDGKNKVEALFVTSQSPADLEKRISILTNDQLTKQLSGYQVLIKQVPDIQEENKRNIPLKKFGLQTVTLDSAQGHSPYYYYYAPVELGSSQLPSLKLQIKKSEMILPINEKQEKEQGTLENNNVELVVMVNSIPHSINISTLTNPENGVYTVNVPIDEKAFSDNRMIELQFVTSGLQQSGVCGGSYENRWIYISGDSTFNIPLEEKEGMGSTQNTLANFPYPFNIDGSETLVILPEEMKIEDKRLLQLYLTLSMNGQSPNIILKNARDIEAEDLHDRHAIFMGGPNVQPLLKEVENQLAISYNEGIPNLSTFGFLSETVEAFSWMQSNPWSEKHQMLVFDLNSQAGQIFDETFLDSLMSIDELSSVAVKTTNNQVFTSSVQAEESIEEIAGVVSKEGYPFSIWGIGGLIALFTFTIILIVIIKRNRR
jgi:cellulose synthase operon protein B